MVKVTFNPATYRRGVANEAPLILQNRYFEANPSLSDEGVAMIARPGAKFLLKEGEGPIRGLFSEPGAFDDALFFVSGNDLYKFTNDGTSTFIGTITGFESQSFVSMAATGNIGETPEFLFIADGSILWVYIENGYARQTLTVSGAIANTDVIRVDDTYYQWTSGSVNAGSPAGTVGNPWLVALGGSNAVAITNMYNAINNSGTPGTTYSTALTIHPTCTATVATGDLLGVRANVFGAAGNAYETTETGANISWGATTLQNGGTAGLFQVPTPDDIGIIDVVHIASYIICIPAQGQDINGRFYWIEPGETSIDALNFATAESSPDPVLQAIAFGDQFWLCGSSSTEVWYPTGDPTAPMQRLKGVAFSRGTWDGTATQVKDSLIIVDNEGGVFQISGGVNRISTPDIEEQIRQAIQLQESLGY